MLVKYAGASGDFYQIHYDVEFAKNNNLPTADKWLILKKFGIKINSEFYTFEKYVKDLGYDIDDNFSSNRISCNLN